MSAATAERSPAGLLEQMQSIDFAPVTRTARDRMNFSAPEAEDSLAAFQQWFAALEAVPQGTSYVMLEGPIDERDLR